MSTTNDGKGLPPVQGKFVTIRGAEVFIPDPRPMSPERGRIRSLVKSFYDIQAEKLRVGQRMMESKKVELGKIPGMKEKETMETMVTKMMKKIREEYRQIGDFFAAALLEASGATTEKVKAHKAKGKRCQIPSLSEFKPVAGGLISTYVALVCADLYFSLQDVEERAAAHFQAILGDYPIYSKWMSKIKGLGPTMAGVILSEVEIAYTPKVGSLWKLAGLAVMEDNAGQSRRPEHMFQKPYRTKDGSYDFRSSLTFNPFFKTKMVGVLSGSFVIHNSYYEKIFRDYKHRLEQHPVYGVHNDKTIAPGWVEKVAKAKAEGRPEPKGPYGKYVTYPGRRLAMAKRYMIKQFLKHLYLNWRRIAGLPITQPWEVAKGIVSSHDSHGYCEECNVALSKNEWGEFMCPCGKYTSPSYEAKKKEDRAARKAKREAAEKVVGEVTIVSAEEYEDEEGDVVVG